MVIFHVIFHEAAIHLGHNHAENNRIFMNVCVEEIKYLFGIVQRLILENFDEIMIVKIVDSNYPLCAKVKISDPQVVEWAKAKVYVFSDSVLCFGSSGTMERTVTRLS